MRLEYRPFTAMPDPKNHPQVIEVLLVGLGRHGIAEPEKGHRSGP